ncbi:hypothetical protein BD410DRAFT_785885 [Rickenella mellea]|uniref:Uncharacterized protein n=1 Tax=Rickenella mellea TaxID=50990 RepID=A0A4Y7QC43_9AGAM|nr:hypothetical protein BD410DRAFT_785885 [Rickenella mellea]
MSLPSPINFLPIASVIPCEPFTFTFSYTETDEWHVAGETNTFTAWVGKADTGSILQTLTNGDAVYPAYWQVGWDPVIASAGEHFIAAAVLSNSNASYTTTSQLFTIEAGPNESCLNATPATAVPIALVPTEAISFATPTAFASSSTTGRTQLAIGTIAGLAIGIIAVLFGLLAAILFVRRRRAARAQLAQDSELPDYATVVRVGPLIEKKDIDGKSDLGPPLDYDRESMRSVPPAYHHGDV